MATAFAPLASRAALAKALLLLVVAAQAAAAFTSFELLHYADELQQAVDHSLAEVDAIESRHALARTLQLGVCAVAGLAFALWLRRARANARALGERLQHRLTGPCWRTAAAAALLVAIGSVLGGRAEAPIDLELAALVELVGNLLGVAAAVLAYFLVDRSSARQAASRALRPPPEPGPLGAGEAA